MIGTCREMCPSSEIRLRERENLLHRFEVAEDHTRQRPKADWNKCVKEYRRPTVGTRDPRPEEIRPPDVLVETLDYLVHSISSLNCRWNDIYDFMFDRLRAIRQEVVVQCCEDKTAIEILEHAVRFHIFSDYRMCMEPVSVFVPKINSQHTQECLKRLLNLYKSFECNLTGDLTSIDGTKSRDTILAHRAEFEATYILFNLGDEDALRHYLSLDRSLRNSPPLKAAFDMSQAFSQKNWVRVFHKFAGVTSPVHICAVHRHFPALHRMALSMMSTAFSSKNLKFPISKLTELLFLNTHMETQNLCVQYGIKVQGENVQFLKGDFKTDAKIERCQSDFINQILKAMTIPDILKGKHSTSTVINAGNSTIGRSHFDQNEHVTGKESSGQFTQENRSHLAFQSRQYSGINKGTEFGQYTQGKALSDSIAWKGTELYVTQEGRELTTSENKGRQILGAVPKDMKGRCSPLDEFTREFSEKCSA